MLATTLSQLVLVIILGTVVFLTLAFFIVLFIFFFRQKQLKNRAEQQSLREAYDRELLQTQVEIQNQTLQHIGQELHDNVGQLLTLARLHLNSAEGLGTSPEATGKVRQANEVLKTTIQAVRTLSKTLDADTVVQHGLAESLRLECDRINRLGMMAVRFESTGESTTLASQTELILFRMAQEVLNNTLKHANAATLAVALTRHDGHVLLDLTDDGKGFSLDEVSERSIEAGGSGLRNLRRRAELLGGTFTLTTQPGRGTQVRIAVPFT